MSLFKGVLEIIVRKFSYFVFICLLTGPFYAQKWDFEAERTILQFTDEMCFGREDG